MEEKVKKYLAYVQTLLFLQTKLFKDKVIDGYSFKILLVYLMYSQ